MNFSQYVHDEYERVDVHWDSFIFHPLPHGLLHARPFLLAYFRDIEGLFVHDDILAEAVTTDESERSILHLELERKVEIRYGGHRIQ